MGIRIAEHQTATISFGEECASDSSYDRRQLTLLVHSEKKDAFLALKSRLFKEGINRFTITQLEASVKVSADYCIGIGHLGNTGRYVQVEPKLNKKSAKEFEKALEEDSEKQTTTSKNETSEQPEWVELDYLKMFLDVIALPESAEWSEGLIQIDWDEKAIELESRDDQLTPLLVVQFLKVLKSIVRKGLRKSYYKLNEKLTNRVKGKVLVGQQIKQNIVKNRFTQTWCSYEVFGIDSAENRFLKKVLQYVMSYIESHKTVFHSSYQALQQIIAYCRSPFELIGEEVKEYELKHIKPNPFFKEYKEGILIGQKILKRFAYNFKQTTQQKIATPPFWIDMPRLFELYIFGKMLAHNPTGKKQIDYQFSTYGNALDILVSHPEFQMVIDAKYKLHYQNGHLHEDIRQVAGYARLNEVRGKLRLTNDCNIDCLIIYPDMENGVESLTLENIRQKLKDIPPYYKVYKLGVKLPHVI